MEEEDRERDICEGFDDVGKQRHGTIWYISLCFASICCGI